jgi:protoheme IX farnesyltransferase
MMPNVKGHDHTRLQILLYTILLAPVGALPWVMGFGSNVYGAIAALGGALMLHFAVQVYRVREGEPAEKAAKHLFAFSILYLFVLFAVLVAQHGFGVGLR